MASLHRDFQSLEVTAGDFCGVAGTPAVGKGWGCVMLVSEQIVYNNLGLE